jgi:nitrogenase subunit NifH
VKTAEVINKAIMQQLKRKRKTVSEVIPELDISGSYFRSLISERSEDRENKDKRWNEENMDEVLGKLGLEIKVIQKKQT